ncbi:hypothetical protein EHW66_18920 [Erwinia psidii]|uniref:High mobility group protein Z n=1 Tax=Erwinia psidii TaxID=69224 RepID=A0A3N6RTZ8_9GAMM|nr:hypothetical protein [Erwinia psidii]MCX8963185.1 hypothetical protein [Erwinia psidii]MCX8966974.1 hypothetical protein [Erwinia psidii]RQM36454.1 hypothetical protein EB241_20555 [Erwinia psidii]
MNWPGSIYLMILLCGLVWMLVKIQRLSRLKNRLHRTGIRPPRRPLPHTRRSTSNPSGRSKHRDADD